MMGKVVEKYAPKIDARFFFVKLHNVRDPLWVSVAHFSKFEPMDVVRFPTIRVRSDKVWVRAEDKVEVTERAQVSTREVSLKLGYVSNPRQIQDEYWYMFKLERWHRCNYDVAKRYWLGDARANGVAGMDYYALLGISEEATQAEIKRAYRREMMVQHPDKWVVAIHGQHSHDYHAQLATRINAAKDCLTDDGERKRYDQQLQGKPQCADIRAWPGRGFGILRAMVEDRGSVVLVKEILSWEPERYTFEGSVPLSRVSYWNTEVRFKVPKYAGLMQVGTETIAIPLSLISRSLPHDGTLRYKLKGIRTGGYSMKRGQVYSFIRVQEGVFEVVE